MRLLSTNNNSGGSSSSNTQNKRKKRSSSSSGKEEQQCGNSNRWILQFLFLICLGISAVHIGRHLLLFEKKFLPSSSSFLLSAASYDQTSRGATTAAGNNHSTTTIIPQQQRQQPRQQDSDAPTIITRETLQRQSSSSTIPKQQQPQQHPARRVNNNSSLSLPPQSDASSSSSSITTTTTPTTTTTTTTTTNVTAWALVTPPGLMGGYRNQVIRLFGMVIGAVAEMRNNAPASNKEIQFLVSSILFSTTYSATTHNNQGQKVATVPMEDLFDVEYWNLVADASAYTDDSAAKLPKLIHSIPSGDCWESNNAQTLAENHVLVSKLLQKDGTTTNDKDSDDGLIPLLERILEKPRFIKPIVNMSLAYATGNHYNINPRKYDITSFIEKCTHPVAYGAGGGRGRLWTNYMGYSRERQRKAGHGGKGVVQPDPLERTFLQALRPHPKWRALGKQCVQDATSTTTTQTTSKSPQESPYYIALHPRIELEMMAHQCGMYMNKNMTKILMDVQEFLRQQQRQQQQHDQDNLPQISGIFVAFSKAGATSVTDGPHYKRNKAVVDENIQIINHILGGDNDNGEEAADLSLPSLPPVFECGEQLVQDYYQKQKQQQSAAGGATSDDVYVNYGSILPSIINFDVAVESTIFIGFRFSSWSNSVWTTRYYLGRGSTNYEYTRERGIQPIANNGLPPPHSNCDGIQDPG